MTPGQFVVLVAIESSSARSAVVRWAEACGATVLVARSAHERASLLRTFVVDAVVQHREEGGARRTLALGYGPIRVEQVVGFLLGVRLESVQRPAAN